MPRPPVGVLAVLPAAVIGPPRPVLLVVLAVLAVVSLLLYGAPAGAQPRW